MRARTLLALTVMTLVRLADPGWAREPQEDDLIVMESWVTAVAGRQVYIDLGTNDGLVIGDEVRLLPIAGTLTLGRIRSLSKSNARIELLRSTPPNAGVVIGTPVEIRVPRDRLVRSGRSPEPVPSEPGAQPKQGSDAPDTQVAPSGSGPQDAEHPPWSAPPVDWKDDRPLLAPALGVEPEERPRNYRGSIFTDITYTSDGEYDQDYGLTRSGADLQIDNPFGRGGSFEFEGTMFWKHVAVNDDNDDDNSDDVDPRLDRFSYWWGGQRGKPRRWELGRFLQSEFPELGILDGVEFTQRTEGGSRVGASFGYMPEPTDKMSTGEDLQAAVYYRWVSDETERYTLGGSYQKSWHKGKADRDLLVITTRLRPTDRTSVYATSWIDFYGSNDNDKDEWVQLTQAVVNASYTWLAGHGLGLFFSHVRWPDIKRHVFETVNSELILDNRLSRGGLNGWLQLTDKIRVSGRISAWDDQDDSGGEGELSIDLRDLLYDQGSVSATIFNTQGAYSDGLGGRLRATKNLDRSLVSLSWDSSNYEQKKFSGSQRNLLQNSLRAAWDFGIGSDWNFSVFGERRFGDEQDAISLGLFLRRSF